MFLDAPSFAWAAPATAWCLCVRHVLSFLSFAPNQQSRGVQNDTDGEMGERPDPPQKTASGMLQRPLARSLLARAFGDHSPRPARGSCATGGRQVPHAQKNYSFGFLWIHVAPIRVDYANRSFRPLFFPCFLPSPRMRDRCAGLRSDSHDKQEVATATRCGTPKNNQTCARFLWHDCDGSSDHDSIVQPIPHGMCLVRKSQWLCFSSAPGNTKRRSFSFAQRSAPQTQSRGVRAHTDPFKCTEKDKGAKIHAPQPDALLSRVSLPSPPRNTVPGGHRSNIIRR